VKYFTRAQMGRCQGGFCTYKIIKIIMRETGLSWRDISKHGGASLLLTDAIGASGEPLKMVSGFFPL
jgi:glycerol-3-phosphate dehydrogenase